ncbi:MAG: Phosphoglucomutase/phosphomannomutase alpha/beta/alpha domain II [candidate division TM6 bacterium GW2011_GWF2_38_10]|nr:MAG: Phosphoglucomutase/phosphomannomutase alpha/beta/alpha domain II [candidate division TM6 bacterium GW2011_GWF2_38_10]
MHKSIFREYDIRGIIGKDFDLTHVYNLAQAICSFLIEKHPHEKTFIIGYDARSHSQPIVQALVQAACAYGLHVINIGLAPSPLVYFTRHLENTPLACVVTASHNPKEYNGIKIWGVFGQQIHAIQERFFNQQFLPHAATPGTYQERDMTSTYVQFMVDHFPHLYGKIINSVIDCGNGAAGPIVTSLIKAMNWKNVHVLYAEPDGTFPHHEADPTVPKNMLDVLHTLQANPSLTLGIGFDGDADRMNPMTKQGELVAGDKLLALYARKMLATNPGAAVVFDIKSSSSLIELLTSWGAQPCISPSGHSLIKQEMITKNAKLAGELSCHFFFNDRYFGYDDGIYAALRLLELVDESHQDLDELLTIIPHKEISPEIRIMCENDEQKKNVVQEVAKIFAAKKDVSLITIDGIRATTPYGWGLLRASNTQPVICLRFESTNKEGFQRIQDDFYQVLTSHFDKKTLHEYFALSLQK